MQFGKSLARLATDIAAGYGARNEIAVARATTLAALNAETQQTLADNTRHRAGVARDIAATAADLRQRLAAGDAALGAAVQTTLAAARQDLAAKRQTISDNARTLRANLDASRRKASDALVAFRTEVRAEQAAAAAAQSESLSKFAADTRNESIAFRAGARTDRAAAAAVLTDSLTKFIAGVQTETATLKAEVQDQFRIARGAWGHATIPAAKPAAPAPAAKPAAAAPAAPPVQARPAAPPAPPAPPAAAAEAAPSEQTHGTPVKHRKRDAEKAASEDEQQSGSTRSFGSFN